MKQSPVRREVFPARMPCRSARASPRQGGYDDGLPGLHIVAVLDLVSRNRGIPHTERGVDLAQFYVHFGGDPAPALGPGTDFQNIPYSCTARLWHPAIGDRQGYLATDTNLATPPLRQLKVGSAMFEPDLLLRRSICEARLAAVTPLRCRRRFPSPRQLPVRECWLPIAIQGRN